MSLLTKSEPIVVQKRLIGVAVVGDMTCGMVAMVTVATMTSICLIE